MQVQKQKTLNRIIALLLIVLASGSLYAQPSPQPSYAELFNLVWQTINDNFYDPSLAAWIGKRYGKNFAGSREGERRSVVWRLSLSHDARAQGFTPLSISGPGMRVGNLVFAPLGSKTNS